MFTGWFQLFIQLIYVNFVENILVFIRSTGYPRGKISDKVMMQHELSYTYTVCNSNQTLIWIPNSELLQEYQIAFQVETESSPGLKPKCESDLFPHGCLSS